MMARFNNIPIEEDTRVLSRKDVMFGSFEAVLERWSWEGIRAESLILRDGDVAALTDEQLEEALRASPFIQSDSRVTITRGRSGYTFINFNFGIS